MAEASIELVGMGASTSSPLSSTTVSDATYRASGSSLGGDTTLLELPRALFFDLLGKDRTLLAALHIKLLREDASLSAILAHPRSRAAFAGFIERVCYDRHSLEAYEAMHAYAQLGPNGLANAARAVGKSIVNDFLREPGPAPRPIELSSDTRSAIQETLPKKATDVWPPNLFEAAEAELESVLRGELMPMFCGHAIFPKVLSLLGQYDAVSLFEDDNLETARDDLIRMVDAGGVERLFEAWN